MPTDAYSFLPPMKILDERENCTSTLNGFDALSETYFTLAYKYYERYPERRLTRLNGIINNVQLDNKRLVVVLRCSKSDGSPVFIVDCATTETGRFDEIFNLIFGSDISPEPSHFVIRPISGKAFEPDEPLEDLLQRFDAVNKMGFVKTLRSGPTGIGFTFESLLDIKENNRKEADYRGIEIKCKAIRDGSLSGKLNLFQQGPVWMTNLSAKDRIKLIGYVDDSGLYACHSQITSKVNERGLMLEVQEENSKINLYKNIGVIGYWPSALLEKRLLQKHSRAVFIKAQVKEDKGDVFYKYDELVYCDRPNIQRFMNLVSRGNIVFEFLMSEKPNGTIRNHGYPWRLTRFELLNELFSFQIKLR